MALCRSRPIRQLKQPLETNAITVEITLTRLHASLFPLVERPVRILRLPLDVFTITLLNHILNDLNRINHFTRSSSTETWGSTGQKRPLRYREFRLFVVCPRVQSLLAAGQPGGARLISHGRAIDTQEERP